MIYTPLCHLINVSIETGVFPAELKIGKLTPIFQKGNTYDPGNYKPMSILPTISKIVERHVASELKDFLHEHELINVHQSGSRQFHSCQTALTKMTDLWLKDIDDGNLTGATFIDFKKSFDWVDHKLLLKKLALYKFDESTLLWFKSYLSNRKQSVHVGGSKSKYLDVVSGVPQESVLGPLLFLVYINDLPLHVEKSKLDMFADDVTLHSSSADMNVIENNLNCDIEKIGAWCLQNRMKINESKTKCMLIGTNKKISKLHNKELNIVVHDSQLNNVDKREMSDQWRVSLYMVMP